MHWISATQFGFDPRATWHAITGLPRFIRDWKRFRRSYIGSMKLTPCFHDWRAQAGNAHGEYFWQDLFVAREVFSARPIRHVDIGSRVEGFVTHVAAFREIEVLDIRPTSANVPGIVFRQVDLQDSFAVPTEYCDSISCLHALEHFGLGRYGDSIDANGYKTGLRNMVKMLETGGRFYLSVPLGVERVEFNSHRVFPPATIINEAESAGLALLQFAYVTASGFVISHRVSEDLAIIAAKPYTLGVFTFVKE